MKHNSHGYPVKLILGIIGAHPSVFRADTAGTPLGNERLSQLISSPKQKQQHVI